MREEPNNKAESHARSRGRLARRNRAGGAPQLQRAASLWT
jgi:hypothetical protein